MKPLSTTRVFLVKPNGLRVNAKHELELPGRFCISYESESMFYKTKIIT